MNVLNEKKGLFGKKIKVICVDDNIVVGRWSEWFDGVDNAWREEDSEAPACESILIEHIEGPLEILITEIKAIEQAD